MLVIEPEQTVAHLLELICTSLGHQVYLAATADEGLRYFEQYHPQIIIVDLNLPDTPGIAMLQALRPVHPRLPILTISDKSLAGSGLDDPFTLPLHKPFGVAELMCTLEAAELLRKRGD